MSTIAAHHAFHATTSDWLCGDHTLARYHWPSPELPAKAQVLLVHGLGEHMGRYNHVAFALQSAGYAVQGYDAAQILSVGLKAVNGDLSKKAEFAAAVEKNKIDSPRGPFTLSKSHNPVQDIYLRQVVGKENKLVSVATKNLADPAKGCKL